MRRDEHHPRIVYPANAHYNPRTGGWEYDTNGSLPPAYRPPAPFVAPEPDPVPTARHRKQHAALGIQPGSAGHRILGLVSLALVITCVALWGFFA